MKKTKQEVLAEAKQLADALAPHDQAPLQIRTLRALALLVYDLAQLVADSDTQPRRRK